MGFYESTIASHRHRRGVIAQARSSFFRSLDAVVVPGTAARQAIEAMGVAPDRIYEGFNAVDVSFFHREVRAARSLIEAKGGELPYDFIYIGQFIARKNLLSLVEALGRLQGRRLLLVGDGESAEELRSAIDQLGVSRQVFIHPPVPNAELPKLLAKARVLVLPSREEVWGLVVNEALAGGLRVVVSRSAGVAPSVSDMQGVFVVDPTTQDLVRGMKAACEGDLGLIERPDILRHTPESFGEVFARALKLGRS